MSREVVRCRHCNLVQYVTEWGRCRRCRQMLTEVEVKPATQPPATVDSTAVFNYKHLVGINKGLAQVMKVMRLATGLSQRDMAAKLGINRVHVSRFERGETTPSIRSVERFAKALGVSISFLMLMAEGALEA